MLPMLKDKSFADEHEIRIYHAEGPIIIDLLTGNQFYYDDTKREFIDNAKCNLPFVKQNNLKKPILLPNQFDHNNISEIWVGSSCDFLEASNYIRKLEFYRAV